MFPAQQGRYFLHIAAGQLINYDDDGYEFVTLGDARAYAVQFRRMAYMILTMPPLGKLHSAFICIADKQGAILNRA